MIDRAGEWTEAEFVRCHFAGQRHRHKGAPVESATEGDETWAFGVSAGDFDRVFDGFCARREEGRFGGPLNRHAGVNALREGDVAFVRHNLVRRVGKRLELFFDGGDHFGMAMTGVEHRNPGREVDHLVALDIPQRGVFRFIGVKTAHHPDAARRGLHTPFI
ncbi:hypothetical protein D3C76_987960 [compost metagenome]